MQVIKVAFQHAKVIFNWGGGDFSTDKKASVEDVVVDSGFQS